METQLLQACTDGDLSTLNDLITKHGLSPSEVKESLGLTLLHLVCEYGHLDITQYLFREQNCNPEATTPNGRTPLHLACKSGHLHIAKCLITEYKCNPRCTDNDGYTPLHAASESGNVELIRYLIAECECDPQGGDNNGVTPLHYASENGHLDLVRLLVTNYNCDPLEKGRLDLVLHTCQGGQIAIEKYLLNNRQCTPYCAKLTLTDTTPLHLACLNGHLSVEKYLIDECYCNPEIADSDGLTPLHCACLNGQLDTVKFLLLKCNCNPQCNTINNGSTPLHFACENGNLELVKYLTTDQNCNPEYSNFDGLTPLHYACHNGHLEVARYLITEHKCSPEHGNVNGFTPLHSVAINGHLAVVKYLISELGYNPQISDSIGWTLLHSACWNGHLEVARYLITEHKCSPEHGNVNGFTPLHSAAIKGHLAIVKYLISELGCNPQIGEKDGLTPLHYATLNGHYDIIKFLISDCNCDPSSHAINGNTPLHCACQNGHLEVAKYLISELGCNPQIGDNDGLTPLHYSALNPTVSHTLRFVFDSNYQLELKSRKIGIFKYLVVEQKCNVQCEDKDGRTPLHYACASGQLDIVQYIYREKLSDLVHTTLSGDTPLHIACKSSQVEITEFLLSTGDCNPLCKNAEGMTPLDISPSIDIRNLLDSFCKGNYPLESVVKVFVLGDPLAGKSSMVQALQSNPGFLGSLFVRFQRIQIKGVKQQTSGMNSLNISSNDFGNVVIYDFAGQREYLTSHAVFLQNSSSQMAGIFIVVTNIAQCENDICHSLQYWVSFILECCAHSEMKPHIIFVGSHEDQLDMGRVDQIHSLFAKAVFSKHGSNQFYKPKGIVHLDCTRPVSPGLDLLRYYLEKSCNSIRKHAGKIDQRCYVLCRYVLHRYVWNTYTSTGIQGRTLESISEDLEGNSHLLPSNPTELLPLFQTLHDKGQVLLLRNRQNPGRSWVITDIGAVLENVIWSIFAPRDFPTHISLGSTGVVMELRIRGVFPDLNTDMIIRFLEHFEFCHRVEPGWIDLSELARSPIEKTDDEFYLFPALIKSERPLHECHMSSYCCGWLMHSVEHQIFTARFLHVLLLRLAFLFSQLQDDAALSSTKNEGPAVKCKCKIWMNGISWLDKNGISSLLEVRDLNTVVLSMTCLEDSRIHCVRLRSQLIQTILKSKHQFCPRVLTEEFIVDVADNILPEVVDEFHSYSIKDLSRRISERSEKDDQDLMLMNSDGSQGKRISELLNFEPYALLNQDLITKLFSIKNAKMSVSDDFITELAKWMYPFHDALVRVLKPSSSELNKKYNVICDSLDEVSKQQLMCEHIIKTWVEQQQRSASYGKLRRQLNRYSIFCGRNPLNLV